MKLAPALLLLASLSAVAQKDVPAPPTADLPYLRHAGSLVATEAADAKEEKTKDDVLYVFVGAASSARTPLTLPIFLIKADKLRPENLNLYRLKSVDGHREIRQSAKRRNSDPMHLTVTQLSPGLYKIDVYDTLEPGEYALSAVDSSRAYCFQVY